MSITGNFAFTILVSFTTIWLRGCQSRSFKSPVWAISTSGSGATITPQEAKKELYTIREAIPQNLKDFDIIYGGSVNAANAESLFSMQDIDGALVGGASLKVDEFVAICRAAKR